MEARTLITHMNNQTEYKIIERSLVELVIESWRFAKTFREMLTKLTLKEDYTRCRGRYLWYRRRLDEILDSLGLRIVEIEPGETYDPGMAVNPVNIEDFDSHDILKIEYVLEPIIMNESQIIKTGSIILTKGVNDT